MNFGFLKIESFKRGILFSSVFSFISKLLLFGQSIAIAYYFGTQAKTDVYFYCIATATLVSVFVNALDASVLIPESMRLIQQEGKERSVSFLNFFLYCYVSLGLLATAVLFFFPIEIFSLFSKFDTDILAQNREIVVLSIPLFVLMITTNLLVNILTSYRFFTIPMIIGVINGILVLTFLFAFHDSLRMRSVLVGQLVAYSINVTFLITLMKKNLRWDFTFRRVSIKKKIFTNILFVQAGNLTTLLVSYVPIYLLSGFGAGILTSLTYGQKTSEIPNQLLTAQVSSVAAIKFNELQAKGELGRLNDVFFSTIKTLLFIMIPVSCITFIYADDIISFFYARGSFDMNSVKSSYLFLKYFGLLLPFAAVNTLLMRVLTAGQLIGPSVIYQVLLNILTIGLIWIGIHYYGPIGYPYFAVAGGFIGLLAVSILLTRLPFLDYARVLWYFTRIVAVNVLISIVVYSVCDGIFDLPFLNVFLGTVVYLVLAVIVNLGLKLDENLNDIIRAAMRKVSLIR